MNRGRRFFVLGVCCCLAVSLAAASDPFDGMTLQMTEGPGPASVTLDWTGGQPTFSVYRDVSPQAVVAPSNLVGTTDLRTFVDTPPPGTIFFYVLKSPCVVNPPEICNGTDDDCDGTIDGPGSEASCQLPNASALCVGGACAISACNPGFGDCNTSPADGCESNLLNDAAHCGTCTNDCDAGLDVCTHRACLTGTCGAPFDRSRCLAPTGDTTTAGACAFAAAGCPSAVDSDGDGFPDTWEDAAGIDYNCDGSYDSGNDVPMPDANKFVKDVYVRISYMVPSTHQYPVQDTSIPGCPITSLTEPSTGHRPQQDSIDFAIRAFAGAHLTPAAGPCGKPGDPPCGPGYSCVDFACLPTCSSDANCTQSCNSDCAAMGGAHCVPQGAGGANVCRLWRLHVDPLPAAGVAHHDIVTYGSVTPACANTAGGGSMTPDDAVNFFDYKTGPNFDPRETAFKHFVLFAHDNTCYGGGSPGCGDSTCPIVDGGAPKAGTSGIAEVPGDDSMVTLGTKQFTATTSERIAHEAGTIMHEIGHNYDLHHGGSGPSSSFGPKVNYLSVMDYLYQFTGIPYTNTTGSTIPVTWRPDYSHQALSTILDESSLIEPVGIGAPGLPEPSSKALIKYLHNNTPVCPCPIDPCTGLPYAGCVAYGSGADASGGAPPIDWNCDGVISPFPILADINGDGNTDEIHDPAGTDDWSNLDFDYQCQPSYQDGPTGSTSQAAPMEELRQVGIGRFSSPEAKGASHRHSSRKGRRQSRSVDPSP